MTTTGPTSTESLLAGFVGAALDNKRIIDDAQWLARARAAVDETARDQAQRKAEGIAGAHEGVLWGLLCDVADAPDIIRMRVWRKQAKSAIKALVRTS